MPEFWDVYDRDRNLTGQIHKRGVPLKNGQFHLVVNVIVINRDGRLLIDRRSPLKYNCPNYWEFTSGSVLAGEASRTGAVRELKEELGLRVDEQQLVLLGSGRARRRFIDTYMLITDLSVDQLTLQADEVSEAKLVTLPELDELCRTTTPGATLRLPNTAVSLSKRLRTAPLKGCFRYAILSQLRNIGFAASNRLP